MLLQLQKGSSVFIVREGNEDQLRVAFKNFVHEVL